MTEITKRGLMVGALTLAASGVAAKTTLAPLPPRRPPVLDDRIYEIAKPKVWTLSTHRAGPWGWETAESKYAGELIPALFVEVKNRASFVMNDAKTRTDVGLAMRAILEQGRVENKLRGWALGVDEKVNTEKVVNRGDFIATALLMFPDEGGFTAVRIEYADEDAVRAHA